MEKFIKMLSEAIERDDSIKMEDEFRNYDEWNSIAYLSVVVMMSEEYGVNVEQSDFKKFRTVQDIFNACNKTN